MPTIGYEITEEQLIAAGYNKSMRPSYRASHPNACALFQKCFSDDQGKKYFIDIWQYDFSKYDAPFVWAYQPEVSLTLPNGIAASLSLIQCVGDSLEKVEATIEDAFVKLGCEYYEKG